MKPGASALTFLHRLETSLKEVANPLFDALYDVCRGAGSGRDQLLCSTPYSLAEKLNIPIFQAHYYPMDITGDCSVPVMPPVPLGREYNRMTYRLAYLLVGGLETRYSHRWCRATASGRGAFGPGRTTGWRTGIFRCSMPSARRCCPGRRNGRPTSI